MPNKIQEALSILIEFGVPREQQNERTALCLLALADVKEDTKWEDAKNPLIGITPMMEFARTNYNKDYAPNTRETFRRFSMHQLVQAGIASYNPDNPARPVNSPKAVYQISIEALGVIKQYGQTYDFNEKMSLFRKSAGVLSEKYAKERLMSMVPVLVKNDIEIRLSPGEHSNLIKEIIEQFATRFLHGAELVYVGDTGEKWGYFDKELALEIGIDVDQHGKMPDVIFYLRTQNWLILVEAVTSHGPVDSKRQIELNELFESIKSEKVFISAFPNRQILSRYLLDIAWESEVWLSDNPTHMIHYNGDKFLGPHRK